jgi:NTE family protein
MLFTLRRFADISLINSRAIRLSLGATNIATGDLEFFDSHRQTIGPEHVLASGSLPPGFPATSAPFDRKGEKPAISTAESYT